MKSDQVPDRPAAAATIRIGTPGLSATQNSYRYSVAVESPAGPDVLWFEIDRQFGDFLSPRADAALLGLLLPAMLGGWSVEVVGPVTDELVHSIAHGAVDLLRHLNPALCHTTVVALDPVRPLARPGGVVTGFSGGIDSFCVLADFMAVANVPPGMTLTHLLYNNVGSHGRGEGGRRLFVARRERVQVAATSLGLPVLSVDSNLDDFYGPGLDFSPTHTIRNATAAHVLQGGVGRFLYASSSPLQSTSVRPSYQMGIADPVLLPIVSLPGLELRAVGGQYSRTEKTEKVARIPQSWEVLDVCVSPVGSGNCSHCEKCLRTMVTLEILGVLGKYGDVFDLAVYRRHRESFLAEVLLSRRRDHQEIRALARDRGVSLLPGSLAGAARAFPRRAVRNIGWRVRTLGR